ncbi:protein-glutamate O-methyltransferase CheR [Actinoplanes sp. NPDC089786]|uniref:CheR family methyltransferase n=1 Tax=Actinoplanes sp. NPDC089786 TaxID=3155185 RepID=UPI00343C9F7E
MIGTRDVTRFRTLLAAKLGWTFADNDEPHLAQELARRAAAHNLDQEGYLRLLAQDGPDELAALAEDLTITETYFFRHGEQFRALRDVALPERMAARATQRVLRLLSVGCSSGEEAYTLGIMARQVQPDPGWIVSVLGLDANPAMVRKAAEARYSAWSLRETPDAVRERWFRSHDGTYEVDPGIRTTVRFRRHNVAEDDLDVWRPEQYDVIFCRNLLMYLTPDTAGTLIARMTRSLAPGGFLFLGHTDSLGSRPDGLEPVHSHSSFFYRRGALIAPPPAPRVEVPKVARIAGPPPAPDRAPDRILTLIHQERFAEALAESERSARTDPSDLLVHGVLLAQAGRLPDAEMEVRALLDANGLDADAHHLLGVCLEGGATVDVAIGHYRLAAYLDPAFAMPRLRLGLLARRRGDHRGAADELERALRLLREERDDRIVLFGGGFGRIALTTLCRTELDAATAPRAKGTG